MQNSAIVASVPLLSFPGAVHPAKFVDSALKHSSLSYLLLSMDKYFVNYIIVCLYRKHEEIIFEGLNKKLRCSVANLQID